MCFNHTCNVYGNYDYVLQSVHFTKKSNLKMFVICCLHRADNTCDLFVIIVLVVIAGDDTSAAVNFNMKEMG